jgi:Putative Flp pilus-assembly TadE/G-like
MTSKSNLRYRKYRKGVSALVVALTTMVLLMFAALVIDLGYARLVQAQLQAAADAAALSGARVLDQKVTGLATARSTAITVGGLNRAMDNPVVLADNPTNNPGGDVVLGVWENSAFTTSLDPKRVNAVLVRSHRNDLFPLFSGPAFGRNELAAAGVAIAVQGMRLGAGSVPYYLPFGLAQCTVEGWPVDTLVDMTFVLSPAGADTTGWAGVGVSPNASWVRDFLSDIMPCMEQWYETGEVEESCAPADTDDTVSLNNGVAASALKSVAEAIGNGIPWDSDTWGTLPAQHAASEVLKSKYGHMLAGPIPVFDGGSSYCQGGGGSWNQAAPLKGFVWGALYDAGAKGAAKNKNVWLRIDPGSFREIGDWYGGNNYGIVYTAPAVVVR